MTNEPKISSTGIFPTYLNLASSGVVFQYPNNPSAEFVNFSSCHTTFLATKQTIGIIKEKDKKE